MPSVPRYRDDAESVAGVVWDKCVLAIENIGSRIESFRSEEERRRWKAALKRTAMRYCRAIEALPNIVRASTLEFYVATDAMLQDERFSLLAIVREFHVARRRRLKGRGPRGYWTSPSGKRRRTLPSHHGIEQMARALDINTPQEPVSRQVHRKAKGHRVTFAFSLPAQAKQRQVADIIEAVCFPNPYDFGRDGKGGHHGAAKVIRQSLSRGECRHFAVADLRDAYPSITARHIAEVVPLSPTVIRNVLTVDAGLTIVSSAFPPPTGRRLPQGAVSSALLLSALLGRSLRHLAGVRRLIVNQGDDIAIGAPTYTEADMALCDLVERLRSLRAGPLSFGKAEVQSPFNHTKLNFCGYAHRWFYDTERFHCAPSNKSVEKMKVRLREKLQHTPLRRRRAVQREYLRAWEGAFPCWTKNKHSKSSIQDTADIVRHQLLIDELD